MDETKQTFSGSLKSYLIVCFNCLMGPHNLLILQYTMLFMVKIFPRTMRIKIKHQSEWMIGTQTVLEQKVEVHKQELSIIQLKSFPNMVSLVVWDHNTEHQALKCFCCLRSVHVNILPVMDVRNRWTYWIAMENKGLWLQNRCHNLLSFEKGTSHSHSQRDCVCKPLHRKFTSSWKRTQTRQLPVHNYTGQSCCQRITSSSVILGFSVLIQKTAITYHLHKRTSKNCIVELEQILQQSQLALYNIQWRVVGRLS